ncbi:MAG: SMP-30/gluconolactonase/LRE family protein [Myxococcales bacterium]|nr:SMP-30/gluconolactonase/LRE family protein [Myxococcales bacterium]
MPSTPAKPEKLLEGLCFPEGPRWHDDRLFFSDMHANRVLSVDLDGNAETIVDVSTTPSGLGFTPDGALLIVSMTNQKLLRLDEGKLSEVADLSPFTSTDCNDMVVDSRGHAYIGNFGFDFHNGESTKTTCLLHVTPEGDVNVAADEVVFPNGAVITPDGGTLILAESFANRLTAFDIADDASLSNRRVFAPLGNLPPDGICLDAEGGVWVAVPFNQQVVRVVEGGEVTHRFPVSTEAFACMLGGPDRRTLFVCTAASTRPDECRTQHRGAIEIVEVDVPGAGLP